MFVHPDDETGESQSRRIVRAVRHGSLGMADRGLRASHRAETVYGGILRRERAPAHSSGLAGGRVPKAKALSLHVLEFSNRHRAGRARRDHRPARLADRLRLTRSISARRSFGSIAPTTDRVISS